MTSISIPKDTINDEEALITDILFASGDAATKGELLLVYESSKASVEVEAPHAGYVHYTCTEGEYAAVGATVATISETGDAPTAAGKETAPAKSGNEEGPFFSDAAAQYIRQKELDPAFFSGLDLVNLNDVLETEQKNTGHDGRIPVIILGGGGHGLVLSDLVRCNPSFRLRGFLDDGKRRGDVVDGVPVLGPISDVAILCAKQQTAVLNAVGFVDPDPALRTRFFTMASEAGALMPPFVHTSATVDPRATLGAGVQIHAGATVGPDVVIEDGAMINTGAVISHHCHIGRHTHIAPGAVLAGAVTVGADSIVGMGVTAYLGITIGSGCVVENGVNLFKSLPDGAHARHD